jgi:transposase
MASKRKRRSFTPEYKAEVVALFQKGGKSIGQVARDLGLTETSVRGWVRQAEVDAGGGGDSGALTTSEREELAARPCGARTRRCGWSVKC